MKYAKKITKITDFEYLCDCFCKFVRLKKKIMRVLLDIREDKVPFMMEMFTNLDFVKTVSEKDEIIEEIKQGIKEVNQIRAGKLKGIPARQLLNDI